MAQQLKIFISSPGDVGLERNLAEHVIASLDGEFGRWVDLVPVRWEDEVLRATDSFQPQITPPSKTDIVVSILWSRLGTRLPENIRRPDGSRYESGTEWEFEDAVQAFHERGTPDLLVYRCSQEPQASLKDPHKLEQLRAQYLALESFVQKWFFAEQGELRAAFKTYEKPDEFERLLENDLRRLILERLPQHASEESEAPATIRWHQGSPFQGLQAFDLEHAPVFYGRTRAIGEIKQALVDQEAKGCAFLLVFGMSGCGKSSLLRAGVLATLIRPGVVEGVGLWRWAIFRPSDTPQNLCQGLAAALFADKALPELAASGVAVADLGRMLAEAPQHALTPINMALHRAADEAARERQLTKSPEPRLLVLIDQLEEMFTLEKVDVAARQQFVAALAALARSGTVWVLASMRSDFYPRCAELPQLVALKESRGQYDLVPPSFDEIGQMISYPSRAAGLRFQVQTGERLDAVLHEAAARDSQALPLLSFVLNELYERRSADGVLTLEAYKSLGGLEGALAQRAETVYAGLPPATQQVLPGLLRALVTVEPRADDIVAARRVPWEQVATTPERRALLDALVQARLLVTDLADGRSVVRVSHEALLKHWPRVVAWLNEDKDFLRIRARVAQHATDWSNEGRRADRLLPSGKPLAEAEDALARRREDLDPLVISYIEASSQSRQRERRRRLAALWAVSLALTAIVAFSYFKWRNWSVEEQLAREREKAATEKQDLAVREATVSRELAEQNRRKNQELDWSKRFKEGGVHLVAGRLHPALEAFQECRELAKKYLADPQENQAAWNGHLSAVLDCLVEVEFKLGDQAAARRMIAERAELRTKTGEAAGTGGAAYQLGYYEATVIRLQMEMAIANEHLKALLKQNELLKQALEAKTRPTLHGGASGPLPGSEGADEEARKGVETFTALLPFVDLLLASSSSDDDRYLAARLYSCLGHDQLLLKQFNQATASFEKQLALHQDKSGKPLGTEGIQIAEAWCNLGNVSLVRGDSKQALAAFQKARQALEAMPKTAGQPGEILDAHEALANWFAAAQQPEAARGLLDRGIALASARDEESVVKLRQGMVERHKLLAGERLKLNDPQGARREFLAAIDLEKRLVVEMPGREETVRLANLQDAFADLLLKLGDAAAAASQFEAEQSLLGDLVKQFPDSEAYSQFASALIRIRKTQSEQTHSEAAKAMTEKLHALLDRWIEQFQHDGNQDRLADGYQRVARFYILLGEPRTALERLDSRLLLLEKSYEKNHEPAQRKALLDACLELSGYRQEIGDKVAADALATKLASLLAAWIKETEKGGSRSAQVAALKEAAAYYKALGNNKSAAEAFVRSAQVEEEELRATHQPLREVVFSYYDQAVECLQLSQPAQADVAMEKCRSLAIQEFTAPADRYPLIVVYNFSAKIKLAINDRAAAEKICQEALAIAIDMDDPKFSKADELYKQYMTLGSRLEELQNYAQAAEAYRRCVRLALKMDSADVPIGTATSVLLDRAKRVVNAYWYVGDAQRAAKNLPAAGEAYGHMIERARDLASKYPDAETRGLLATAHENMGELRIDEKKYPEAKVELTASLEIRLQLGGDLQDVTAQLNLSRAYRLLSKQAEASEDFAAARDWSQKRADTLLLAEAKTHSEKLHAAIVNACVSLSWNDLLTGRPQEAIAAALEGMKIEPDSPYLALNLAHGYLFSNQFDKAKVLYVKYQASKLNGMTFPEVVREDFAAFRKRGLDNAHLAEIEAVLK